MIRRLLALFAALSLCQPATAANREAFIPSHFAPGARVCAIGDSIMLANLYPRTSAEYGLGLDFSSRGEVTQALALDPRFWFYGWPDSADTNAVGSLARYQVGANLGFSGWTSGSNAPASPTANGGIQSVMHQILTTGCQIAVVAIGRNDWPNGSIDWPQSQLNILAIVDELRAHGIKVVLGTIRPELTSGTDHCAGSGTLTCRTAINAWIKATFGAGTSRADVVVWDAYAAYAADGPIAKDFWDGVLHPGAYGAQAGAWGAGTTQDPAQLLGILQGLIGPENLLQRDWWPQTNYVPNPIFATATGGAVSKCTGAAPSAWQISGPTGLTCVISTTANPATGGNSMVMTATTTGTNSILSTRITPSVSPMTGTAALAGKWVSAFAEVDVDAAGFWATPYITIFDIANGTTYVGSGMQTQQGTQAPAILSRPVAHKFWLQTPPIYMGGSGMAGMTVQIYAQTNDLGVSGTTGTLMVDRVWLGVVGDPRGRFNHCLAGTNPC